MQISESTSDAIVSLAFEASKLLMRFFKTQLQVTYKDDNSPVTDADHAANQLIVNALRHLTPGIPIISEESHPEDIIDRFWLIDPLDGTRAYVKGKPEFSICLGLVEHGRAVYGALAVPPQGVVYVGGKNIAASKYDAAGVKHAIRVRQSPAEGLHVVKSSTSTSRRMRDYLEHLSVHYVEGLSSALKFGLIAEGKADMYPRFGPTMEWDTAAGHAIVEAAGGSMTTMDGEPFLYHKPHFANGGFVVRGRL